MKPKYSMHSLPLCSSTWWCLHFCNPPHPVLCSQTNILCYVYIQKNFLGGLNDLRGLAMLIEGYCIHFAVALGLAMQSWGWNIHRKRTLGPHSKETHLHSFKLILALVLFLPVASEDANQISRCIKKKKKRLFISSSVVIELRIRLPNHNPSNPCLSIVLP